MVTSKGSMTNATEIIGCTARITEVAPLRKLARIIPEIQDASGKLDRSVYVDTIVP